VIFLATLSGRPKVMETYRLEPAQTYSLTTNCLQHPIGLAIYYAVDTSPGEDDACSKWPNPQYQYLSLRMNQDDVLLDGQCRCCW
jgi:hypothetical protein